MTELEDVPEPWSEDRQPMPSELLVNLLNALAFERSQSGQRKMRQTPSDAFKLTT